MKKTLITLTILLGSMSSYAQNVRFTTDGVIEFERKTNMYATLKKRINKDNETYLQPAYDSYRKNQPQFKILKSTLTFSNDKSLFTPLPDTGKDAGGFWGSDPNSTQNNTIFSDLANSSFITQKKVFEETFLIRDSLRKINWKLTSETREIAGYECRRANAIMMDSIYVVAFYTDKIPVSGGPESFSGLPGMILGVALPHENVSWFATSVKDKPVTAAELKAPVKGKAVNTKGLNDTLNGVIKDWGSYAQTVLKALTI
ncbi:GLPGLI family protein [Pedobacter sp. PLR]|uniref:GLPGLI family protein n=1 Tax=Pedobacter sp. PLR TaxID=2994465 RepID=UPI0022454C2D|nr:GLPGLI family protein [Pedobacter sp. PLR]MCX2450447.1 GLPGLI family protein [Pedobacter sp. PLR]